MKKFMDQDFLLETDVAKKLYEVCEKLPVIDYHCHLSPQEIAENKQYQNLTEIWLGGDHYKWRQMRAYGIQERFITGDASAYEKFEKWAETIEHLIGNPLHHWTHLELQRYFGIYEPLTLKTAPAIWEKANAMLQTEELSVRGIFKKFNIHAVGTTDDPVDSLEWHRKIADGSAPIGKISTKVVPSFRPDRALDIANKDFNQYIKKLSEVSGINISSVEDVSAALENRLDYFIEHGCVASDHGMSMPPCTNASVNELNEIFRKGMEGSSITTGEVSAYQTYLYVQLGKMYAEKNIAMQYHMNAIRDNNSRMMKALGPNTGFDAVHDMPMSSNLAGLLDLIESNGGLPKTIVYSLNPSDYYPMATVMACFQNTSIQNRNPVKGQMQLGSAWWFCDHRDGMEEQLRILAAEGMLSTFIGMLTDSRSFLSYPRHEYFRRILCNLIGKWVENGEYPEDWDSLKEIVSAISFDNAKNYFGV